MTLLRLPENLTVDIISHAACDKPGGLQTPRHGDLLLKRPLSVLAKPTSSRCNLNCSYCFYLRKAELYPWADHPKLSPETFELFSRQS